MTEPEDAAELVRGLQETVWNEGDLEAIAEYVAEDFVQHDPGDRELRGREEYREFVETWRDGFSDFEETTEDVASEGDTVAHRFTMRGTHDGEVMGVEPTGETVEMSGMAFSRIEDGLVAERWVNLDALALLEQLGAVERPE